ncbi:MAG: HAMP domain-containing histidine kinase [Lachnospiraceae bacterium]|nr:HAMP domain-containing histidine kinase [Lachnospiraceae bacterium]
MSVNSKMTSIARRINMSFWLKRFWGTICLDIVIVALIGGAFFKWRVDQIPEMREIEQVEFETGETYKELVLIMEDSHGEVYHYQMYQFLDYVALPFCILLVIQGLDLVGALFETGEIRRKLKPLNDLAIKAEKLSSLPLDSSKFESLEQAIESISPNSPDAKISTGDKDLASIEVALNNLIYRMRESQKQQARFVSDASHELRTPIAVIQGYVNMLDRWGKEDESILEESIEALKHESEHMKELVEQLLFLARGENGKNTLHYSTFDLNEVIHEVWEESLMIDEEHRYEFVNDLGSAVNEDGKIMNPPAMMRGDVAMIKQSVRIFVQNAAKYSVKGATISFRVKTQGDSVCYVVQDEGIGMKSEDVVHIFEPFYRSDKARNGNTGGSGLGLSIAKWIVDAHEGKIEVLSSPDIGTRFTVWLKADFTEK